MPQVYTFEEKGGKAMYIIKTVSVKALHGIRAYCESVP